MGLSPEDFRAARAGNKALIERLDETAWRSIELELGLSGSVCAAGQWFARACLPPRPFSIQSCATST
jgi:hypothetical protein